MKLSHWNIAVEFTGDQAAALALGTDPAGASYVRETSEPLFQRMKQCYNSKKEWLWGDMSPMEDGLNSRPDMLESVMLRWWASQVGPGTWHDYCQWVKNDSESEFECQRFTRQELVRWLSAIKVNSIYQFETDPANGTTAVEGKFGSGSSKRWTQTGLDELKATRDKVGTKGAAAKFNISEARVRQLLPGTRAAPKGFSAFSQQKK